MSKESDKNRKDEEDPELDDEQEEEEEEEEDEEEGEEEDEEEEASNASSKAASADDADEEDDEEDEEDDEEDEEDDEEDDHHGGTDGHEAHADDEDPYWWTPHVVLGVLVLVGILGFFGMFNKPLAFLAAKPAGQPVETTTLQAAAPAPAPQPTQARPMPQQPQQQPNREMFGAKHFLVMYKGSMRAPATITRTKEEAKARAEEGLKKVKGGKKFEEVVAEYSDEPGAGQRGGDLGSFPKGAMVPEFQAGLEKVKVGEVSDLVETSFGYHVILRTK